MASKALQAQRFVQIINQQLDVLKEERNTLTMAVDECINQVQSEVDAWVNGGPVNQTTWAEMSNKIQQVITLFIEKSVELSGKEIEEIETDLNQTSLTTTSNFTSPGANLKFDEKKRETLRGAAAQSDSSQNMTMRFAILEEVVYSLKKTTEKVEDKIENFDKILKDVSTQQVNDHKKVEVLTNAKLKSEKKLNNKMTDLEKRYQDLKSTVDDFFETVTNVDDTLNRLEDENKSVNVSINELNKQISSVRACSNDAFMSIQDLSKSVESTNQHYNEMSNKMNQLEISINLMSSQYKEQFENSRCLIKDKADDLIGMACQLLIKRLTPLEKLNEILNKKVNFGDKQLSEKDAIETRVAEISNKITEIELKCNLPKVGFLAIKEQSEKTSFCTITSYGQVIFNHGCHFNQSTGIFTAPLKGLYLLTIVLENPSNSKINKIRCYCQSKDRVGALTPCVSNNESITVFLFFVAGDTFFLRWEAIDENDKNVVNIYFSCFMIQMWT